MKMAREFTTHAQNGTKLRCKHINIWPIVLLLSAPWLFSSCATEQSAPPSAAATITPKGSQTPDQANKSSALLPGRPVGIGSSDKSSEAKDRIVEIALPVESKPQALPNAVPRNSIERIEIIATRKPQKLSGGIQFILKDPINGTMEHQLLPDKTLLAEKNHVFLIARFFFNPVEDFVFSPTTDVWLIDSRDEKTKPCVVLLSTLTGSQSWSCPEGVTKAYFYKGKTGEEKFLFRVHKDHIKGAKIYFSGKEFLIEKYLQRNPG